MKDKQMIKVSGRDQFGNPKQETIPLPKIRSRKNFNMRLREDLRKRLKKTSEKTNISQTRLVEMALNRYLP